MLAEYADLDESPTARYIYAGSQRIALLDSLGNVYYCLNDHLGSAGSRDLVARLRIPFSNPPDDSNPKLDFRLFFPETDK